MIQSILEFINEKRHIDLSDYRREIVENTIHRRIFLYKCLNISEYLDYLKDHDDEIGKLLDEIIINTSSFFRNTLTFEYFYKHILLNIIYDKIKKKENNIRIWSTCCSTGEEPYSLAILINEFLTRTKILFNIDFFATDIDVDALNKARKGIYSPESVIDVKYGLFRKYFSCIDEVHEQYIIHPCIKKIVNFSLYDILDKKTSVPEESIYGDFDIVLCRNVLIYYSVESHDFIFNKIYRSLVKGGYLFLGETEMPTLRYINRFQRIDKCCHIYTKI
ncbi:MAG: protein-glutamate O-methyltransferase CheR [Spirochaetota bacterium]|nr:protein-glutamate O-methyltransferase CheR [Spirochaetota bacterium]